MQVPNGATVIVADGQKVRLFRNTAQGGTPQLHPMPNPEFETHNRVAGVRRQNSDANPGNGQEDEDSLAAGVAAWVNAEVTAGRITALVVVAAPRTLGELRHGWSSGTQGIIAGEIDKDLGNHDLLGITQALERA
jgi:protein required for attachment to host cells